MDYTHLSDQIRWNYSHQEVQNISRTTNMLAIRDRTPCNYTHNSWNFSHYTIPCDFPFSRSENGCHSNFKWTQLLIPRTSVIKN